MSLTNEFKLKLIGKNEEDLKVISAYLQDSIVAVRDIIYLKKNRTFIMVVNRFMWEDVERGVFRQNKRIRCAVKFEDVTNVRSKNVNQNKRDKILECLAIKFISKIGKDYEIRIFFSGDSIITINAECIEVVLDDLSEPWNVKHVPKHKI